MNDDFLALGRALLPDAVLVLGALLVLGADLGSLRRRPGARRLGVALTLGALAVVAALVLNIKLGTSGPVFGGAFLFDPLANATRGGVCVLTLLTLGVTAGARIPRHPAEYVALLLLATTGFTLMAAAGNLLIIFLSLELASLSLYVLAGFDKSRVESAEAALKYFLFGGVAAAFLLFGFSLIYGLTGTIELRHISHALAYQGLSPLLLVALVMVLVAFGFKAAAAPFHLWAPDAYQGAPAPSAALIASGSKLAGVVLFIRLLWPGLGFVSGPLSPDAPGGGWLPIVALMSGASLLLGNFGALAQSNVRRLLAYSAIAHAGVMLLGVIVAGPLGPGSVYFYAATYGIATAGAFGVIAVVDRAGGCQKLEDLAGLRQRSPLLCGALLVFILSLAGIPPLAGFFGKFAVFAAALKLDGLGGPAGWLAVLGIALSAVALYYYLLVLKQALVAPAAPGSTAIRTGPAASVALVAAMVLLLVFGVLPSLLLGLVP